MKRKLISIVVVLAMAINLISLSGCGQSSKNEAVTRGEWVTMLAEAFGMDSYEEATPVYTDVSSASPLFPYVQSSAEWDVLSIFSEKQLKPEKNVTREEVASTAAIAAGFVVTDEQYDAKGRFDAASSVDYAVKNGILNNKSGLSKSMTQEECEAVVSAARVSYLSLPVEEKSVVVTNEELVDLTEMDEDSFVIENGSFILPEGTSGTVSGNTASIHTGSGVAEVSVGDVFMTAPTEEEPTGVAYKATAVEEVDGEIVITTEEPTLEDLFEELDVSTTVAAEAEDIIWLVGNGSGTGVRGTATNNSGFNARFLSARTASSLIAPIKTHTYGGRSLDFTWGSGSFERTWSNDSVTGSGAGAQALKDSNFVYNDTPSIEDFNGTTEPWSKSLEIDNSFSGGYKITGNISINAITVTAGIEYNKNWLGIPNGIKNASVQVTSDISSTLTLQGTLSERLHIATVPVVIIPGLSVDVELYLYATATGSLVVTASLGSSAKVEYANGKLRHTADSQATANVDANLQINFGAELEATLRAGGIVSIIDVGAKVGGEVSASAGVSGACIAAEDNGVATLTYQESLYIKADLYVPFVNLYTGSSSTLIGKLGLHGSWDIMNKGKGAKHYSLADYEWVFWEETVLTDGTEGNEEGEVGASNEGLLDLKNYSVSMNLSEGPVRLELELEDGKAAPDVVWTSDNTSIATVDENGMVTPIGEGSTVITATLRSDPNVYVKCAVHVWENVNPTWEFLPPDLTIII